MAMESAISEVAHEIVESGILLTTSPTITGYQFAQLAWRSIREAVEYDKLPEKRRTHSASSRRDVAIRAYGSVAADVLQFSNIATSFQWERMVWDSIKLVESRIGVCPDSKRADWYKGVIFEMAKAVPK